MGLEDCIVDILYYNIPRDARLILINRFNTPGRSRELHKHRLIINPSRTSEPFQVAEPARTTLGICPFAFHASFPFLVSLSMLSNATLTREHYQCRVRCEAVRATLPEQNVATCAIGSGPEAIRMSIMNCQLNQPQRPTQHFTLSYTSILQPPDSIENRRFTLKKISK